MISEFGFTDNNIDKIIRKNANYYDVDIYNIPIQLI